MLDNFACSLNRRGLPSLFSFPLSLSSVVILASCFAAQAAAQAPTITSVSPAAGSSSGGTVVTITGTNFVSGPSLQVQFGLNNATAVSLLNSTQITATTPAATNQADDSVVGVTVISGDGQQAFLGQAYNYHLPPSISSLTPAGGPTGGGNRVQINGQNFRGLPAPPTVSFGASPATNVVFNSGALVTVTAPAGTGTVSVTVTDADGQSANIANGYTYSPAPTITSVSPPAGSSSGGTIVTITGTNFSNGPGIQAQFGANPATQTTFVNATTITATTPAASNQTDDSIVGVTVVSGDGQQAFLAQAYAYHLPPSVTSLNPSGGATAGGTQVQILGQNFRGLPTAPTVAFGGVAATNVIFNSGSMLTVTTPAGSGTVGVTVTDADGQIATLPNSYTYGPPPTITSLAPATGSSTGGTVVTITGTHFINGAGLQVQFGVNAATNTSFVDATHLTATTPAAANQADDSTVGVTVINGDGQQAFLPTAYSYHLPPSITSISPAFGPTAGGNQVQITGQNFRGAPSTPTITFGGVAATNVVFHSGTTLSATAPAGSGTVTVVVNDADGQSASLPNAYVYSGQFSISGQITSAGLGLQNVVVSLSNVSSTQTDVNGNYSFSNVQGGGNYTVTPSLPPENFSPPNFTILGLNGSQNNVNFTASTVTNAQVFVPVTPCRIADTRNANGPFGGPVIAGNSTRSFVIPNSACGIPPTATAYSLNVTVVPGGPLGFITVWPDGQNRPLASTLNSSDGRVKANAAVVPAGHSGAIDVFASNQTHLVLDINGYYIPATGTGLAFYPLTPCRLVDTRTAAGPLGGPSLSGSRTLPLLSSSCNIPVSAQAYALNFTAVPHGPLGYLTTWAAGASQPLVSTLNAPTGTVTANAAAVPAGNGGAIDVFASNNTDLIVDINGYFAAPGAGGLSLYNFAPCRVLDTRNSAGSKPFNGPLTVNVIGSPCSVPGAAQAFVFNSTVVPPGSLGFLALWPQGQNQPAVSTLNAIDGAITSNLAIVPTTNGQISSFADGYTHLLLDLSGYFAP